jgi:hypothetical protein
MVQLKERSSGMKPTDKRMTVRIPIELWKKIRRLEEAGKIQSIQDAIMRGLEWITKQ